MLVTRKKLIIVAATAVVLFAIANPLGDAHHGLGRHNAFLADAGQTVFIASLIAVVVLIALAAIGALQLSRRALRDRRTVPHV